jgi:hypothetical protein
MTPHRDRTAIAAGLLVTLAQLGLLATYDAGDLVATTADPLFRAFGIAYAASFVALVLALVRIHARHTRAAGRLGAVAFPAAVLGTMALGADMWFEAFASPWLVGEVPAVLTAERTVLWQAGYLSAYLLFALGWTLFGLASLRARVLPAAVGAALVLGGLVGFWAARPPFALPLALAVAAAGLWPRRSPTVSRTPAGLPGSRPSTGRPGCA